MAHFSKDKEVVVVQEPEKKGEGLDSKDPIWKCPLKISPQTGLFVGESKDNFCCIYLHWNPTDRLPGSNSAETT